ncbi:S8 family peptidase [Roseiconus nitratireducens]|uniref:S8 family peptidase n=1 Tax=Roseiconus nitratireducens TaxID=2605748 RepID=A0A5M6CZZ6_9BACT|nr:S8 family peptidase [Roseiconus nitratireducens]KAA5540000.1 S8 family peptidase [Roseiconus nitratireducens]
MADLPHLFPRGTAQREDYKFPYKPRFGTFPTPPRDRRPHATQLADDIGEVVKAEEAVLALPDDQKPKGRVIEFLSEPDFPLKLESLDYRPSGIEIRAVKVDNDKRMRAAVFVPDGKLTHFIGRLEKYATQNTKSGSPKNQALIESISRIRIATLETFWNDAGVLPTDLESELWWEIWLSQTGPEDVVSDFRQRASQSGVVVADAEIRFPERCVVLVRASFRQLSSIKNLFDVLAELRLGKLLAGEVLALPPSDQADIVDDALSQIEFATPSAPTVCHLDTGVNRSHPLLRDALAESNTISVDPSWNSADRHGHGTEMAGIALYGCLTSILKHSGILTLEHNLESVKMFRHSYSTEEELWGALTAQAVSRIEIANPDQIQRVYCLTLAASARDEGFPSSWSASIDQLAAGVFYDDDGSFHGDDSRRLIVASAGNLPLAGRSQYPDRNLVSGIEDPGQSWNALTIGGMTDLHSIITDDIAGWQPLARPGGLSPASRTSVSWDDKSWPVKPDVVFEAGNMARHPESGDVDFVDDLSLLTTRISPDGALFTTTGDTSGATAMAARFMARLWSRYPNLRPETIRALTVHSARHSPEMLRMTCEGNREAILRCFGWGAPNFAKASASTLNAATMVIESQLQPFQIREDKTDATKDMHLHHLPWPKDVLLSLGDTQVAMRITLSYFVEPSPGRVGWKRKHRYQSHGLRFDVKRPTDNDAEFLRRITAASDNDEEYPSESDDRDWRWGRQLRCKGSIHCDVWSGIAADLAASGVIAVYPVTGWWRERKHLGQTNRIAKYSMVVSIETERTDVDLYTPIEQAIAITNPST